MKTKELKNKESIPKSIMMLFASVLLVMLTLAQVGCSSKDDEIVSYTVMFDADGGAPTPASQHVEAGKTVTAPSANPTKTGYVFLFWHSEGASTAYNFNTPVSKNITLYAKWQAEATAEYWQVAWELNEGTWTAGDNHATKVIKGGTLIEPIAPTKAGKIFDGWYKEASLTNKVSFPYDVSAVTANITLYAKWSDPAAEYWQITWELNGGAWPPTADNHVTKIEKGSKLAEPAAPTKAGSTFDGWYKEAALTNKITFPYDIAADTKLYAKWVIDGSTEKDPDGYTMFESIAELKTWLINQPFNTFTTEYKIGLKGVNLDAENNWGDLGVAVKGSKYIDLNLQGCTGTTIPDGREDRNGTTVIHYGIFANCDGLQFIKLPSDLTTIGKYAFYDCDGLISIEPPHGLEAIGEWAFYSCDGLVSVVLPTTVKTIDNHAFRWCKILRWVNLPKGLQTIGQKAFATCGLLSSVIFPEGLKSIGDQAFYNSGLQSVDIPAGIISIGSMAFSCPELTSVTLPEGITVIGEFTTYCRKLSSINIPSTVTTINNYALRDCKVLASITLPKGLKSIGKYAFIDCYALDEVVILSPTPPSFGEGVFKNTSKSLKIKVPPASLEAYKTASGWNYYADKIVANTN